MTDRTETPATPSLGQHRGAFDVGSGRRSRRLLARWIVAVGAGLLCVGLLLLAVASVERSELRLLANDGERQLDLHAAQLAGLLARFDYLPRVLSTDSRFAELLRAPDDAARLAELESSARSDRGHLRCRGRLSDECRWADHRREQLAVATHLHRPVLSLSSVLSAGDGGKRRALLRAG